MKKSSQFGLTVLSAVLLFLGAGCTYSKSTPHQSEFSASTPTKAAGTSTTDNTVSTPTTDSGNDVVTPPSSDNGNSGATGASGDSGSGSGTTGNSGSSGTTGSTGPGGHGTIIPVLNPAGNSFGGPVYVLPACMSEDAACSANSDCCSGMTCSENSKTCVKPFVVPPVHLPSCTPTGYADGRAAVPFVITVYRDVHNGKGSGVIGRFVESTPYVTMNDVISFVKISRGPNYVEGDKVRIYDAANYISTQPYIELGPGEYDLTNPSVPVPVQDGGPYGTFSSGDTNLNDRMSSISIIHNIAKACADGPEAQKNDGLAWTRPIPVIAEAFENAGRQGRSEQLTNDITDLHTLGLCLNEGDCDPGFNDRISSVTAVKGPDYQAGDFVRLYENAGMGGGSIDIDPNNNQYTDMVASTFNDMASSVAFFHKTASGDVRVYTNPSDIE